MNRTIDETAGAAERRDPGATGPTAHGFGRAFVLLSIPVALFAAGVTYLLVFSDLAEQFDRIAGSERSNGVRYAVEHTPPPAVPHLMAAVGKDPATWDRRQVDAVADLLARSGWPDAPTEGVENAGLLSRAPEQWTAVEAASVDELLQRFRSFHATLR